MDYPPSREVKAGLYAERSDAFVGHSISTVTEPRGSTLTYINI